MAEGFDKQWVYVEDKDEREEDSFAVVERDDDAKILGEVVFVDKIQHGAPDAIPPPTDPLATFQLNLSRIMSVLVVAAVVATLSVAQFAYTTVSKTTTTSENCMYNVAPTLAPATDPEVVAGMTLPTSSNPMRGMSLKARSPYSPREIPSVAAPEDHQENAPRIPHVPRGTGIMRRTSTYGSRVAEQRKVRIQSRPTLNRTSPSARSSTAVMVPMPSDHVRKQNGTIGGQIPSLVQPVVVKKPQKPYKAAPRTVSAAPVPNDATATTTTTSNATSTVPPARLPSLPDRSRVVQSLPVVVVPPSSRPEPRLLAQTTGASGALSAWMNVPYAATAAADRVGRMADNPAASCSGGHQRERKPLIMTHEKIEHSRHRHRSTAMVARDSSNSMASSSTGRRSGRKMRKNITSEAPPVVVDTGTSSSGSSTAQVRRHRRQTDPWTHHGGAGVVSSSFSSSTGITSLLSSAVMLDDDNNKARVQPYMQANLDDCRALSHHQRRSGRAVMVKEEVQVLKEENGNVTTRQLPVLPAHRVSNSGAMAAAMPATRNPMATMRLTPRSVMTMSEGAMAGLMPTVAARMGGSGSGSGSSPGTTGMMTSGLLQRSIVPALEPAEDGHATMPATTMPGDVSNTDKLASWNTALTVAAFPALQWLPSPASVTDFVYEALQQNCIALVYYPAREAAADTHVAEARPLTVLQLLGRVANLSLQYTSGTSLLQVGVLDCFEYPHETACERAHVRGGMVQYMWKNDRGEAKMDSFFHHAAVAKLERVLAVMHETTGERV